MLQPVIRPTAPHFATKESLQAPSTRSGGSPIRTQNSACPVGQISGLVCASRTHERGATRSSRVLGAGCNGRAGAAGRATPMRTAKSCGPDLPTLGSSLCATSAQTTVAIKPGTPGRARISRQTVARGMPVAPAEPVVTAACFFCCRRAMGAACIRHSPRPLFFEGRCSARLGRFTRRGNAE